MHLLTKKKSYRELALIYKFLNGFFTITVPKQPRSGIYGHANDSFRELVYLASKADRPEFILNESTTTNHCWLEPSILLNDRPTLEWVDNEFQHSHCIMLGNGDINVEGKCLEQYASVKPWIFWPRSPQLLESYLKKNGIQNFGNRKHLCTFIGNIENSVQEKHRKKFNSFENFCDVYELSLGSRHKYSKFEYMDILGHSKFGLCLQGYGKKCHREIEFMALGTVPVLHENIPAHSYADPLVEGIHYLKVKDRQSNSFLKEVTEDKWVNMSNACHDWYLRNVHSNSFFEATLNTVLSKS